jgi:hypothetical protein
MDLEMQDRQVEKEELYQTRSLDPAEGAGIDTWKGATSLPSAIVTIPPSCHQRTKHSYSNTHHVLSLSVILNLGTNDLVK